MSTSQPVQLRTACNRDCPDACSLLATVQDGRVVRLQGDPRHPVTQGFLCHRTSRFLERQYSDERITEPLWREGDSFRPISWDQALGQIAAKMLQFRSESGPTSILYYRSGGSLGLMKHVTDHFFERFGPVTLKSGDICTGAGDAAQMADFGEEESHDLFDVWSSRSIVLWGKNLYASSVHLIPVVKEARRRGARLILIDPVWHRTAELCDRYLQPRPGGDAALALGVARVLFERQLVDPEAPRYCDHLEAFRGLATSRSLDEWAAEADVAVCDLEALAELYAERPVSTLIGWGLQRRTRGSATIRVIDALAAISGNLGLPGGGVSYYFKRRGAFDLSFTAGLDAAPRAIPEPMLGRGMLAAADPPIRMVWVTAGNPVAMLPESRTVAEALRTRELTVVVDSFLTDTARCAHLVLPTTTLLEDDDLLGAYGHHWLAEVRPVAAPPPGVKTDYEIAQLLAQRVGLAEHFSAPAEEWKRRMLRGVADRGAALEDLRSGPVRNPQAPRILFADRQFATPTGRVNLIHQLPAEATPVMVPEPGQPPRMLLMPLSTEKAQGSQWVSGADQGLLEATVHPDSAPGFGDGQAAVVESELGRLRVRLRFDTRQRRDVLLVPKGGWLRQGRCANALIPARVTDAGGCAVYYDTPVRLLPDQEAV
ncbi:MAG: molybdopterin-dependent oxidoreductase [Pirellulaceae bacterium]|nr:molybdopterin-dependent oxidoreductase [Pirellulaceae bacterium]